MNPTEPDQPADPGSVTVWLLSTEHGPARVHDHRPAARCRGLLVLGHGAGGGVQAPDLVAVTVAAVAAGWRVVLVEQPYRVAGRRVPPRGPQTDQAWLQVCTTLAGPTLAGPATAGRATACAGPLPVVTGGRSYGGRVACRTADQTRSSAVVCLAYPLHPPRRPEVSRADELDGVTVPVLVVQGERDPFGCPAPAPGRTVVRVPGDHALKKAPTAVADAVLDFLTRFPGGSAE